MAHGIFWKWREPGKHPGTWRVLGWRMNEEQAAAWAKTNKCKIEKVEGSGETRQDFCGLRGYGGSVSPAPG